MQRYSEGKCDNNLAGKCDNKAIEESGENGRKHVIKKNGRKHVIKKAGQNTVKTYKREESNHRKR